MSEKKIHGYSGSCAPGSGGFSQHGTTFSVGVFELIKKKTAIGYKHGPVLVRVKGFSSNPEAVYVKAKEIVAMLDAGEYSGPKNVMAKH